MHRIQKYVVQQLVLHPQRRYSEIKPADVQGNLFMYHLKQLMKRGLLTKAGTAYLLSPEGLRYADQLSLADLKPRIQPKIVTLLALQGPDDKYLLYKRSRQPFIGQIGFPYGKIHLGERVGEAAERELREKTGLQASLSHRGDVYLTVRSGEELVSHMLCHVFAGSNPTGELTAAGEIGECFWSAVDDPADRRYFPGFEQIFWLLNQSGSRYFFDEVLAETS